MAVGTRGRELIGPLLVVNLVAYLIVLGLAGWSLDKYINGEQNHPRMPSLSLSLSSYMGISLECFSLMSLQIWEGIHQQASC
jgi:hypothetical protein